MLYRISRAQSRYRKALNHHHLNQPAAVSDHFIVQGQSFKDIELIPLELDNSHKQWQYPYKVRVKDFF